MTTPTQAIQHYLRVQGRITVPELQRYFHLTYREARVAVAEMEESGRLALLPDGLTFEYIYPSVEEQQAMDAEQRRIESEKLLKQFTDDGVPLFNIKALNYVLNTNNSDLHVARRYFNVGLYTIFKAFQWCVDEGYLTARPEYKILITKDQFAERYGRYIDK